LGVPELSVSFCDAPLADVCVICEPTEEGDVGRDEAFSAKTREKQMKIIGQDGRETKNIPSAGGFVGFGS